MEPMELNGGRFYLRPLLNDDRVDDTPALALVSAYGPNHVQLRRNQWLTGTALSWAVCEQTQVELLAEALLIPDDGCIMDPAEVDTERPSTESADGNPHSPAPRATRATVRVLPAGNPARVLPNDPDLERKTVADAVAEAEATLQRWAESYLQLQVNCRSV